MLKPDHPSFHPSKEAGALEVILLLFPMCLEGRLRRNNLKIVGVPEGEERGRPTEFIRDLLQKPLRPCNFGKQVTVDHAHQIPVPKPEERKRSQSIIARIHFYQEKELILRFSRQQ